MLLSLVTAALFLTITSSNALSLDTSHHLARHQHIAARHPPVKRASVSTRCKKRNNTSAAAASNPAPTAPPAPSSSSGSGNLKGKVGIAWPNGDVPYLKNFITDKVSAFVDFFFSSSFPNFFSLACTIGALINYKTLMDWNLFQCYGARTKSLTFRTLSRAVTQVLF
jgi:hypothetical protein